MAFRTSVRWRRARSRRLVAAVALASAAGGVAALASAGPAAPVSPTVRALAATCLPPLITCPPSPTASHSSTAQPSKSGTPKPAPRTPAPPGPSSSATEPPFVQPPGTPLATLPPPSPGAPPAPPPDLSVQDVAMDLASEPPLRPGAEVLVQATLEAQRGTDTYAVPHAGIAFSITSQSGVGAFVDPATTDSGDTGVVVVTVQTGDQPGDTVVHAVAGNAQADFTVHSDPATPRPRATATPHAGAAVGATNGTNSGRRLLVSSLAALLAAMTGSYVAALVLGRLPNPFQRSRVWGRRGKA